ncbi:MAG TPA: RecX family transcriptional regulator [Candidatus Anoxymicrobiaceae bacterium]
MDEPPDDASSSVVQPSPEPEALGRALRFIEYRPRSAGETRARLRKSGYDVHTSEGVIDYLTAAGIIDDREFGRLFLNELMRKELGPYRVRSELLKKKLDRELVDELMEEWSQDDEAERARSAAARRFRRMSGEDPEEARKKLVGFLVRKGYSRRVAEAACRMAVQVDTQSGAELE